MKRKSAAVWGSAVQVFGGLGLLLCIASVAGVWMLSGKLGGSVDRLAKQVTGISEVLREPTEQVGERLGQARAGIENFERRVKEGLTDAAAARGMDLGRLGELVEKLRLASTYVRNWIAAAEAARDAVTVFGEVLDSVGFVVGSDGREEKTEAFSASLEKVREASEALDKLAGELETARADPELDPRRLEGLLEKVGDGLLRIETGIGTVVDTLGAFEEAVAELGTRIARRLALLSVIATVLIVWMGIGQLALMRWGATIRRRES